MSSASPRIDRDLRPVQRLVGGEADNAELHALRALLLSEDRAAIRALTKRLDALEGAAGPEGQRAALEGGLLDAVRTLQNDRFAETSSAFAPLVVGTIRTEIVNSRDAMVDALYPITGRLVTAAVSDAFRKLLEQINARFDGLTSGRGWRMRARALLTGRSVGEVALAELGGTGLRRILLIERGSGVALARWAAASQKSLGRDDDIVSGLITVISALAEDAFAEGDASLRSVDLNGRSVILHASPQHIIAIEVAATLGQQEQVRIHEACVAFLSQWSSEHAQDGGADDVDILSRFAATLAPQGPTEKRRGGAVWFMAAVGVALLAFVAWSAWSGWQVRSAGAAARTVVAETPALTGWPVATTIEEGTVVLRGTVPQGFDRPAFEQAIREATAPVPVTLGLAPVDAPETRAKLAELAARDDTAPLLAELMAENAALTARLARLESGFAALPAQALTAWAQDTVLGFSGGVTLSDAGASRAALAQGAALLSRTGATLTVLGHSDALGSADRREAVALSRAEAVRAQLIALGAPEGRVLARSRGDSVPISDLTGPGSPNRRVTFDLSWD